MHLLRSVPLVLLLAPTLVACDRAPSRFETELRGPIMGTTFSVKVVTAERLEPARRDEIEDRVVAALEGVNATMSTWLDDSELSRFNGATTTEPIPLSPDTLEVIAEALEIGSASGGALDVTVGPLVDLWGFGPAPPPESLPSLETIDEMRSHTGLELLEVSLEHGWARKQDAALEVDLSSIA